MNTYQFESDTVHMKNLKVLIASMLKRVLVALNYSTKESRSEQSILQVPYAYQRFVYNYENLGPVLQNSLIESAELLGVFTNKLVLELFYLYLKGACLLEVQRVEYTADQITEVRNALYFIQCLDPEVIIEQLENSGMFRKFREPILMIEEMLNNDLDLMRGRVYIYSDGTVIEREEIVALFMCVNSMYINYAFNHILELKPELLVNINSLYYILEISKNK